MEELQFIYQVARQAPVSADIHDQVNQAVQKLAEQLTPKTEQKNGKETKTNLGK